MSGQALQGRLRHPVNRRAPPHAGLLGRIHAYLAPTHLATAEAVADTVVAVLSGLSAGAREGWDEARLLAVATIAAAGIADALR